MQTAVLTTNTPNERARAVARAVELLKAGEAVALPTETVYGLAADAFSPSAVVKIFEAKERPRFDPLIVHLPSRDALEKVAVLERSTRALVEALIARFWPGPLTLVLPSTDLVPTVVAAGLETVAVRMSAQPVFAEIVREFGRPLAAPSANRFGRISPTAAGHVLDELSGRIPLIVDAGPTEHGIESTIVAVEASGLTILREGPVTRVELSPFGQVRSDPGGGCGRLRAPGQLPSHYAPHTPLLLTADIASVSVPQGKRYGALVWSSAPLTANFVETRRLSATNSLREAAANLFGALRELDAARLDCIVAEAVPEEGLGIAIMDRLRRAAH